MQYSAHKVHKAVFSADEMKAVAIAVVKKKYGISDASAEATASFDSEGTLTAEITETVETGTEAEVMEPAEAPADSPVDHTSEEHVAA